MKAQNKLLVYFIVRLYDILDDCLAGWQKKKYQKLKNYKQLKKWFKKVNYYHILIHDFKNTLKLRTAFEEMIITINQWKRKRYYLFLQSPRKKQSPKYQKYQRRAKRYVYQMSKGLRNIIIQQKDNPGSLSLSSSSE